MCRGLLLLAAVTFSVPGRAEQDLVTMVDTPAAMAIAAGDLDGDGRADIALIEASLQKTDASGPRYDLHLHFQKDGKFSAPADKTIAVGAGSSSSSRANTRCRNGKSGSGSRA